MYCTDFFGTECVIDGRLIKIFKEIFKLSQCHLHLLPCKTDSAVTSSLNSFRHGRDVNLKKVAKMVWPSFAEPDKVFETCPRFPV